MSASKVIFSLSKTVFGFSKVVSGASKVVFTFSKTIFTLSKTVSNLSKTVSTLSKTVFSLVKAVSSVSKVVFRLLPAAVRSVKEGAQPLRNINVGLEKTGKQAQKTVYIIVILICELLARLSSVIVQMIRRIYDDVIPSLNKQRVFQERRHSAAENRRPHIKDTLSIEIVLNFPRLRSVKFKVESLKAI